MDRIVVLIFSINKYDSRIDNDNNNEIIIFGHRKIQ